MSSERLAAAALAIGVTLSGVLHAQRPATPRTGAEIYSTACVTCHAADGKGSPASSIGFDLEFPDFSDCKFSSPEADADWQAVIEYGGPVRRFDRLMPAFGEALGAEEIEKVIAYLRGFCRDRRWPLGDLNLPRPLVTEKAFPENEALMTTAYEAGDGGSLAHSLVYERRVGARGQYEVEVPIELRKSGGDWTRGLGDIAVAYKHVVFDSARRGSILSAGIEALLPTGKETSGLGGGVTRLEPFAAYGQILPREAFFHVQTGFDGSTNHDVADDETFVKGALGQSFSQANGVRIWTPMVELAGVRELSEGQPTQWDVVPQIQITLSPRQHVIVNLGARLPLNERADRSRTLLFYFLWDWFDGGLLEGW
jgi:mono/diheme cytochrome c family protein